MKSPLIFISHVKTERAVAEALMKALEKLFENGDVFVSGEKIDGGTSWFDTIKRALAHCDVILVSATKNSKHDPWIMFEAGAGIEKNKTIPIIWGSTTFPQLDLPLSQLQGRKVDDREGFKKLLKDIIKLADLKVPPWSDEIFDELVKDIQSFTQQNNAIETAKDKRVKSLVRTTVLNDPPDSESLTLHKQAESILHTLLIKKLISLKPLYQDIPSEVELYTMTNHELIEISAFVNAFDLIDIMHFNLLSSFSIPTDSAKSITKKQAIKDLNSQIDLIKKLAQENRIDLNN